MRIRHDGPAGQRGDGGGFPGVALPISQIAIELYEALPGGVFLGGRFAPDSAQVAHLRDLTPADSSPDP